MHAEMQGIFSSLLEAHIAEVNIFIGNILDWLTYIRIFCYLENIHICEMGNTMGISIKRNIDLTIIFLMLK